MNNMDNKPLLSILIPSIPSRFEKAFTIYNKLLSMVGELPIEVLMFTDNKKRSIGKKREALVKISNGEYVCFVDDDEDVFEDYIISIYNTLRDCNTSFEGKIDLISFKSKSTLNGESFIVDMDVNNPINEAAGRGEDGKYIDIKRKPFHICVWRSEIAKSEEFPDSNYGEDWAWCEKLLNKVGSAYKIDSVLHHYIWSSDVTEAELDKK